MIHYNGAGNEVRPGETTPVKEKKTLKKAKGKVTTSGMSGNMGMTSGGKTESENAYVERQEVMSTQVLRNGGPNGNGSVKGNADNAWSFGVSFGVGRKGPNG